MTAKPVTEPRSVLITGASSGIGAALARMYAAPDVHLAIGGRYEGRLAEVATSCRERGAEISAAAVDVCDAEAMEWWTRTVDDAHPLDLVIANAGISGGTAGTGEGPSQARRIFAVNVTGTINTVQPAVAAMRRRRRGQIAIMSSLAAFRGLPGAPAYSASKAAVRAYGEALRGAHREDGIAVSVICPGFVRSRMTAENDFPMPFLMDADRAARIIRRGLARNRARIAFPWLLYFGAWLSGALSPSLTDLAFRRLPKKG